MSTCPICNSQFTTTQKTGRPAVYCSVGCRRIAENRLKNLSNRLSRLSDQLSTIKHNSGADICDHRFRKRAQQVADIEAEIRNTEADYRELVNLAADS